MTTRHHPSNRAERRAREIANSRSRTAARNAGAKRRPLIDSNAEREADALVRRLARFGISA